jgi:hypothetical protein
MTETDPLSEMLYFLEYRTMDKAQKPNNPECHTPSSKPFRIEFHCFPISLCLYFIFIYIHICIYISFKLARTFIKLSGHSVC